MADPPFPLFPLNKSSFFYFRIVASDLAPVVFLCTKIFFFVFSETNKHHPASKSGQSVRVAS